MPITIAGRTFPSFPDALVWRRKGVLVMRILKEILITFALVVGLGLTVSAQKNDPKKPPPKGNPPVVNPGQKPPRDNPRNDNTNKPKKPGGMAIETAIKNQGSVTA